MSLDLLSQVSRHTLRHRDMRPRATIRVRPHEFPFPVRFFEGDDDLDAFEAAALEIRPDTRERLGGWQATYLLASTLPATETDTGDTSLTFLLLRYRREPEDQFTVLLPDDVRGHAAIESAIQRVVAALNLPAATAVNVFPPEPAVQH